MYTYNIPKSKNFYQKLKEKNKKFKKKIELETKLHFLSTLFYDNIRDSMKK